MYVDGETELTFISRTDSLLTCGIIYVTLVVFLFSLNKLSFA